MKRQEKKATRLLLEELEPRILHSADVAVLVPPAAFMPLAEVRLVDSVPDAMQGTAAHTPAAEASASAPREIAIVDSSVEDYQRLVDDLMANSRGTVEVFVLDAAVDGVGQISRILSTQHDIQTIHLISHGSEGAVQLGAGVLNQETLVRSAAALARWADALTADADILIYGCDVAAGPGGRAFVDALSGLTGADVAASDDLTGSAARGGDWTLEYRTGHIESSIPIDAETQRAWNGTLAIGAGAASSAATVGAQSALTFAHTVGSGTDRLLVVEVSTGSADPVTSVTYGGAALTQLSAITDSANRVRAEVWYMAAPSSGTANVVVSMGATTEFVAGATSFSGVDQSTTFGTPVTAGGAGGAPSVTVASAVGEIVFDVVALRDRSSGAAGGAQTALWTNTNGTGSADAWGGSSTSSGAASVTTGWSSAGGGAGEWAAIAVAMKAAPAVAPVLTGANALTAIDEDASANPGTLVSALLSGHVTDGNSGASSGIAVTAVDNTNGAWQYSTNGGAAWTAFGTPGSSTARLLAADASSYVRFVPAVNWNGVVAAGLTFRAWDQTSGTAGGTADTTANGGATAFSSSTAASGITVNAVNDAPVLAGTNDMAGINRNPASNPGTLVADLLTGHLTDPDTGAVAGIAVTAVDNTNGAWQYSTDGGAVWTAFGAPGTATARLLAADVATFVRFVPNANYSGTVASGLSFHAWDQTTGAAGATADATVSGGATAFSSATASASIIVSAANTAPTLTGSSNLTAVNEDQAANAGTLVSALLAGFTSDADPGALTGIAVTAVDNTNGAWQYSLDSGAAWTSFGSPAVTSARLLAADASTFVRFVPNADWNGTVNGGITFRAWDRSTGVAGATADTSGLAGTFRDNFQTASYANNDGTLAWTGSWIENDSQGGGAASGRFEITSGTLHIQAGNTGDNIYREANLSGATGATLSFTYGSGLKNNAVLQVQVSTDGGANYTTLPGGVFDASTNTFAGSRSFDLTSSIASNTRVRWYVAAGEGAADSNSFYLGNIQITASARNGGATAFSTATASSGITVNPVNDAPVRTAGSVSNLTVLEDAVATSLGLGALAYAPGGGGDESAQSLTYTVTALPSAALGAVTLTDGTTAVTANTGYTPGQLQGMKFKAAANASGGPSTFSWNVADSGGTANGGVDTLSQSLTVTVTSVNDAPSGAGKTVTTLEDTAYTFSAGDFGFADASDSPANALSSVGITTVPGAGTLAVSGVMVTAGQFVSVANINAGNLKFTPAANANGAGYASFTFQVRDDGGVANGGVDTDPTARTMIVDVTAVNDAPAGANRTVGTLEDTAYTFSTADFGYTDTADTAPNALLDVKIATLPGAGNLTLSGVAVASGQFVSAASIAAGNLKFNPAANANGAGYASFTFQVQDDGGVASGGVDTDPTARTMTVNVTSVNDAPSGASKTVTTLEDTAYTFATADFGFTDPADPNALLDVKITTLPGAGNLTLSGVAVAGGQFVSAASIAAGSLKFNPAANVNGAGYASFTFEVRDDGGVANGGVDTDPIARTMTVNVTSVNDAPAGASKTVTTLEDTAYTFITADFGFTDSADTAPNALLNVRIATLPATGSLTLSGVAVAGGQLVSAVSIAAGDLKFAPAANANGNTSASFTFQVQDDGGTAGGGIDLDPTPKTMTVSVTAVNDAPAGTDRTLAIAEDTAYTFSAADFGFTDPADAVGAGGANAPATVRISTLPLAGTLANDFVAVTSGQLVSLADIDAGKLIFIPAANANGAAYATFNFQVKDDGGVANGGVDLDTIARSMTMNVTPVNDAPAGADKTVSTLEDTAYIFSAADFGFTDPNDANALLSVRVATLPATGALTLAGIAVTSGQSVSAAALAAGGLRFTPAANQSGAAYASFTFQVQDDGGIANGGVDTDAIARTLTMDVTSVNDAPSGASNTVMTLEDAAYVFRTSDFGFADAADSNALLAVKIGALPGAGNLTLRGVAVTSGQLVSAVDVASGAFQFNPAPDANGAGYASFAFQVQDDGGVANGGIDLDVIARTMTVNVTPVNDAPSGADATVVTLEDTAYTFGVTDFGFSDRDGSAFLAVRIAALPTAGSLALAGAAVTAGQVVSVAAIAAGDLTLSPAANANGAAYASFAFQVQDGGGTANGGVDTDVSARTLTLNVISVNDAPAGADTTVKAREDTAYTFSVTDFGYTDPSDNAPNALLNVKIGVLAGAGSLTLGGVAVSPGQIIPVARITAGALQFTPARSGTGTGYATLTFQLQDDGGVANGGADSDGTPRTITVDVIRTRFPDQSVPGGPVIVAEQPAQAPAAAAAAEDSKTSEADARAKSTLAKIAASLAEALAQTRVVAGNDIDAQVSVLSATPPTAADAVSPRSAPSSASARAVVNGAIVVAPDLALETKPEGAISMIAVTGVRAGAAPGAAVVENAAEEADPKKQAYAMLTLENGVRASAIIVSAGMVSWTLQGAGLIASLLTSAPAWRHLDPMPVLAPEEEKPDWGENDDDAQREEDAADSMWRIDAKRRTVS